MRLGKHPIQVRGENLGTHITVHHFTNLPVMRHDGRVAVDVLVRHKRRVGGHPVQDPQVTRLAYLLQIGCVYEKSHNIFNFVYPKIRTKMTAAHF